MPSQTSLEGIQREILPQKRKGNVTTRAEIVVMWLQTKEW